MARATANAPLTRQVEASLRAGRAQQALDLAKQIAVQKPGPDTQSLLRRCYLAVAEGQVARDAFRDAHAVLSEAECLSFDDPAWWTRLAELRADLGNLGRALQLLERVPDAGARPRVLGRIADRALRDEAAGRALLPADLQPAFDLVRRAFAEYESGRDDAARETLNGIGLSSPFLEWKLLIRGLMAWTANDAPRAIENWSRLTPDRLPARLADPFRIGIDRSHAARLPADRLSAATRQADRLSGGHTEGLRRLRKLLASEETIPEALETARSVVPELKRAAPDLVGRLGNVVYWALVAGGQPDDLPRYNRVFGPPADDPQFFRLHALVTEQVRRLDLAHGMWRKYEEWIEKSPNRWPGPMASRARALVFERMGRLARDWIADDGGDDFDRFDEFMAFFNPDGPAIAPRRKPLAPSAEQCFRRASELAPDWAVPATQLLHEYESQPAKAAAAADDLLRRFPTNLDILEAAAELFERVGDVAKAHDCLKRALAANPLDRRLRQQAAALALNVARRHAEDGQFDAARAALREATDLGSGPPGPAVLALAAAIDWRVGEPAAAERHVGSLMILPDARLAGPYRMAVEGSRLKLKKKDLAAHQAAFAAGLAGSFTAVELAALLNALDQYRREPVPYRGLKTHEKKILDRVASAAASPEMTEDELVNLGLAVHGLKLWRPLRAIGDQGVMRFGGNAHFPFFQAEVAVARQRTEYVNYRTGMLYCRVKIVLNEARDSRYRKLQELLDERARQTPDVERWLSERWGW